MAKLKDESFQAVSRGLINHLSEMTNGQAKLYLYCLLRAKNQGEKKGSFSGFALDIADGVGWDKKQFYKVLKRMDKYLDIKYGKSRHWPMVIKVKKFKALPDFYCSNNGDSKGDGKDDSNGPGKGTVRGQLGDSNSCKSNDGQNLETPNKGIREKGKRYIDFFNSFWEIYPKRNGKRVGKKTTWELFQKIPEEDLNRVIRNAKNYGVNNEYPKDPERFLKKDFWMDWDTPQTAERVEQPGGVTF